MKIELEVIYYNQGKYSSRKWVNVDAKQAHDSYSSTVAKMTREGKETIVCLRSIEEDGTATLLNVTRTNIYDTQGSIEPQTKGRQRK